MYFVSKRMEIAGAHNLKLPYKSKCQNIHGHNWIVTVYIKSEEVSDFGMVMDFTHIKRYIHDKLDHSYINEVLPDINPTAENMARWILETVNSIQENKAEKAHCYKVTVQESEGNIAAYTDTVDGKEVL